MTPDIASTRRRRFTPEPNLALREMPPLWTVPKLWTGETVVIFGGGPSLEATQVQKAITAGWKRIACNDAYRLDLEADVLCWGDARWYGWNAGDLERHRGMNVTWVPRPVYPRYAVRRLERRAANEKLSTVPTGIVAESTGQGALNLAYLLGATRIILVGFDMKAVYGRMNWHDFHQRQEDPALYPSRYIPAMAAAGAMLNELGVEALNATPDSALTCFPMVDLEDLCS